MIASAYKSGALQQSTTNFITNPNAITNFNFSIKDYENVEGNSNNAISNREFKKYATMASAEDWKNFANGWNNNTNNMQTFFDEYHLIGDIDFSTYVDSEGKQIAIDPVGVYQYGLDENGQPTEEDIKVPFNKVFNGNGYTLSNVLIDTNYHSLGLFGNIKNASISNLNINGLNFNYGNQDRIINIGSFAGHITNSNVSNINISNVGEIKGDSVGIASGWMQVTAGGFAGTVTNSNIRSIILKNVESIKGQNSEGVEGYWGAGRVGGFMGVAVYSDNYLIENIFIDGIGSVENHFDHVRASTGGFYGDGYISGKSKVNNIVIKNIDRIYAKNGLASGFASGTETVNNISNIYIYFSKDAEIVSDKGDAYKFSAFYGDAKNVNVYYQEGRLVGVGEGSTNGNPINYVTYKEDMEKEFDSIVAKDSSFQDNGWHVDDNGNLSFIEEKQ
ncbi:hypothetical protein HEBU111660_07050 [Helicobacter burdigaliensis]